MIVKPLLSLKKNTNGELIFSHAIMTKLVNIFIDEELPDLIKDEENNIAVPISNFIEQDNMNCLKKLLGILQKPVIKSLVNKEKQLLEISSLGKIAYCGLIYTFKGPMETNNIRVYFNPKFFRSIATLPVLMMNKLLQISSGNDLILAKLVYGNTDQIKERFVGKKGNSLVFMKECGITALGCIERIFSAHRVSPDTKITVIFSYDVKETHVDIRTGTNQPEFAYAPDVVEGMGPCVLETPLIRSK